ncbi:MAG TPA: purine-nucleoside phosphorylase [Beutenbergiaceae bacterium]|nr:purine-nucleoside phosphorylase [Beutenbergiaceae bacterium]
MDDLSAPQTDPLDVAERAARMLTEAAGVAHIDVALQLGSGWANAHAHLGETVAEVSAGEVPGFISSPIAGHSGTLSVIRFHDDANATRHALILGARTHLYEGYGVRAVVHGVRTAAAAGVGLVVLTNGCGSLHREWEPGTPVVISDHINLTATSPVEGARFVDLTDLYSPRVRDIAQQFDPSLNEGVYVQFRGPHYETPAEVQMAKTLGGDLVGMSTAIEAIAARQAGVEVFGVSLVTNLAAGISPVALSHDDVVAAGVAAQERLSPLLSGIVRRAVS